MRVQARAGGAVEKQVAEQPVEAVFVDYRGAEKITSLSRWTLARHVEAGRLRAYRVGSVVRFKVSDLVEFVERREART
jgi:excisionase family DNA binding protein